MNKIASLIQTKPKNAVKNYEKIHPNYPYFKRFKRLCQAGLVSDILMATMLGNTFKV